MIMTTRILPSSTHLGGKHEEASTAFPKITSTAMTRWLSRILRPSVAVLPKGGLSRRSEERQRPDDLKLGGQRSAACRFFFS